MAFLFEPSLCNKFFIELMSSLFIRPPLPAELGDEQDAEVSATGDPGA